MIASHPCSRDDEATWPGSLVANSDDDQWLLLVKVSKKNFDGFCVAFCTSLLFELWVLPLTSVLFWISR